MKTMRLHPIAVILLLCAPFMASAASIVPETTDLNVVQGKTISVQYMLTPRQGEKAYTVKLSGNFPADLLTLTSFTFADKWIALPQPGYDEISNANGAFIKTAGYPRGTTTAIPFGTATFTGKGNGTAHVAVVDAGTAIYNSKNKNIFNAGVEGLLPAQLFDIRLLLDSPNVARVIDLVARATFTSFGRVPTPITMTFSIVDASGNEVWKSADTTTVQTEAVFIKRFFDAPTLLPGSYTLELHTTYNTNVEDDFTAPFSISPPGAGWNWVPWFLGAILLLLVLLVVVRRILAKRRKEREERGLKTPYV